MQQLALQRALLPPTGLGATGHAMSSGPCYEQRALQQLALKPTAGLAMGLEINDGLAIVRVAWGMQQRAKSANRPSEARLMSVQLTSFAGR